MENNFSNLDSKNLVHHYDNWPQAAQNSLDQEFIQYDIESVSQIVLVGMGGSGTIADIIDSLLSKSSIPTKVIKGFELPSNLSTNPLVIAVSASGNTTETLSVLQQAYLKNYNTLTFSSGGNMESFCKEKSLPFVKTSVIHSPRCSLPNMLFPMLKSLQNILKISNIDISNAISVLKLTNERISYNNDNDNISKNIANWINHTPLVYYPYGFYAAALRFKNSLQENSKIHALTENIIEGSHNSVAALSNSDTFQPILIRGEHDHPKTIERWEILKEFLTTNNIDFYELFGSGRNILEKLLQLIYILDYSSIYLAFNRNIDPTPISNIDFMKERITLK